jgi:peptidyl-prolyl cis-trans isomerase SurA
MKTRTHFGALLTAALLLLCAAATAEVLDRSIAVANGHLITWSDLAEQMRFEALENGRSLKDLTPADRREAFDHLVQNWIVRDQMQGRPPATGSEIDAQIAELRSSLHVEKDDARWNATLRSYGISPEELRKQVANQLEILSYVEFRVRPLVRVSRAEIDEYYNQKLVPQLEEQGQRPEPEAQLRPQIRQLLREQKVNEAMDKWLQTLRSQAQVELLWNGVQ